MAAGWTFTTTLSRLTLARAETLNALFTGIETGFASVESAKLSLTGGTMSGALAMGSNKITGLDTPTADADAATKAYVDAAVDAAIVGTGPFSAIDVNGGTIDGTTIGGTVPAVATFSTMTCVSVNITGGTITGITDLAVADGGSGASTAAGARTNFGVDVGVVYATKSGNYTALATDNNAVHIYTATATVSLTAAATLGADWHYTIKADGADVTVDPDASETINGASTYTIYDGNSALIICDGTNFQVVHSGPIITKFKAYTPTFVGAGTPSNVIFESRRNGKMLEVCCTWTNGTATAVPLSITMGFNGVNGTIVCDSAFDGNRPLVGTAVWNITGAGYLSILALGSSNLVNVGLAVSGRAADVPMNGSDLGTGTAFSANFTVPIEGWD